MKIKKFSVILPSKYSSSSSTLSGNKTPCEVKNILKLTQISAKLLLIAVALNQY